MSDANVAVAVAAATADVDAAAAAAARCLQRRFRARPMRPAPLTPLTPLTPSFSNETDLMMEPFAPDQECFVVRERVGNEQSGSIVSFRFVPEQLLAHVRAGGSKNPYSGRVWSAHTMARLQLLAKRCVRLASATSTATSSASPVAAAAHTLPTLAEMEVIRKQEAEKHQVAMHADHVMAVCANRLCQPTENDLNAFYCYVDQLEADDDADDTDDEKKTSVICLAAKYVGSQLVAVAMLLSDYSHKRYAMAQQVEAWQRDTHAKMQRLIQTSQMYSRQFIACVEACLPCVEPGHAHSVSHPQGPVLGGTLRLRAMLRPQQQPQQQQMWSLPSSMPSMSHSSSPSSPASHAPFPVWIDPQSLIASEDDEDDDDDDDVVEDEADHVLAQLAQEDTDEMDQVVEVKTDASRVRARAPAPAPAPPAATCPVGPAGTRGTSGTSAAAAFHSIPVASVAPLFEPQPQQAQQPGRVSDLAVLLAWMGYNAQLKGSPTADTWHVLLMQEAKSTMGLHAHTAAPSVPSVPSAPRLAPAPAPAAARSLPQVSAAARRQYAAAIAAPRRPPAPPGPLLSAGYVPVRPVRTRRATATASAAAAAAAAAMASDLNLDLDRDLDFDNC